MFSKNDRIWVRIVRKNPATNQVEVLDLAPGIVLDPNERAREVRRSQSKGGNMLMDNTIVVITHRDTPSGAFYVERAEQAIGVVPRNTYCPVVDGPKDVDPDKLLAALRKRAAADLAARLTVANEAEAIKAAEERYSDAPAFAV